MVIRLVAGMPTPESGDKSSSNPEQLPRLGSQDCLIAPETRQAGVPSRRKPRPVSNGS
jgi:hypothetical protein